ncbi:hypothetical protein BamMEX5DRAFT_2100 [Burkholderia ambifaria MEX-5]|uniref:Uncharacterized protein n=1 Tax=Burkholderia ambifaria MEX-5 TaxID=396597 RepID=B1T2T4_9BURK|nr:hypothetical protein BamMEX5DRAFT_2100 [Burkholderia ambifaria MEX-5]
MVDNGDTRRHALSFRRLTRAPVRTDNREADAFAASHAIIAARVDFDAVASVNLSRASTGSA